MRAERFKSGQGGMADFFLRPPTLTDNNFKALKSTDPIFTVFKDLNLFKKCTKNQETSCNFRLGLDLSNRPHLHRAYLVTVCRLLLLTVCTNLHSNVCKSVYQNIKPNNSFS